MSHRRVSAAAALCVAFCAADASAENNTTIGSCSPIITGSGAAAKITITCNGVGATGLEAVLSRVNSLIATDQEKIEFVRGLIEQNASRTADQLSDVLRQGAQNLYETVRLQYKLSYEEILVSAGLRYTITTGVLKSYGRRIEALVEQRAHANPREPYQWPTIWPFGAIEWLSPASEWFPNKKDGDAYRFLMNTQLTFKCYSRAQRADPLTGPKIDGATTIAEVNLLPRTYFGQTIRLAPASCGTGMAVGKAFQIEALVLHGEYISPIKESVERPASLISALDLFGGVCYGILRNDFNLHGDAVEQSIADAVMLQTVFHLTNNLTYASNRDNSRPVAPGLFRWYMPQNIADLDRVQAVGDFSPVKRCQR